MFYNIAVYAGLTVLEAIAIVMMARSVQDAQTRRIGAAIILAVCAVAAYLGVWVSPARGSAAEDGLRPFLWFGLLNVIAFVVFVITSRLKYGKPRSSS